MNHSQLRAAYLILSSILAGLFSTSAAKCILSRCRAIVEAITWAMDDEYAKALAASQSVLADYRAALAAKTKAMNDLLNYQIPYFRCSDQEIVKVYYYLWAIYLMYYIDVGRGWEMYPPTQTAVNNFLGMHRVDGRMCWPKVLYQRKDEESVVRKTISVSGNPLTHLKIQPWLEEGTVHAAPAGYAADNQGRNHIGYHFEDQPDASVTIEIEKTKK